MEIAMASSPVVLAESSSEDLREQVRRDPGTLYAILDACDEPGVVEKARLLGPERAVSLYRGSAEEDYSAFAPYLARVDESLVDWIVETLGDAPWGIFAVAAVDLETLRRHFRRFLKVRGPDGEAWYFRFYDPRILPSFLASCSAGEAEQLFGPVQRFAVQVEKGRFASLERPHARDSAAPPLGVAQPKSLVAISATNPLRIRQEHIQAMQPVVLAGFEQKVVAHLKASFPEQTDLLGDEHAREVARYGLHRAQARGITAEREVLLWITLMVLLGSDFDEDVQLAWVQQTLGDPALADPIDRMDRLYEEAMTYLDRIMGAKNEHLRAALARLDAAALPDVARSFGGELRGGAMDWLRSVWPEKCEAVGADRLLQLVSYAVGIARRHSMAGEEAIALHLGLAFFLGIGVDDDPQFPWVASVLSDPAITSGAERVLRLEHAARSYWQHWLS